jgi:hypothetical protein
MSLFGIYEPKYKTDTCTPLFVIALFTIAKLYNQPRFPTNNKWIKEKLCTYAPPHTMEYYSLTHKEK